MKVDEKFKIIDFFTNKNKKLDPRSHLIFIASIIVFLMLLISIIKPENFFGSGNREEHYLWYLFFLLLTVGIYLASRRWEEIDIDITNHTLLVREYLGNIPLGTIKIRIEDIKYVSNLSTPETDWFQFIDRNGKLNAFTKRSVVSIDSLENILLSKEVPREIIQEEAGVPIRYR